MVVRFQACSQKKNGVPFHLFCFFGVVWSHNRVPLGPEIPGIILLYDVLVYIPGMYLYIQSAAVGHRVPDGKKYFWFIESDSIQCSISLI